MNEKFSYQTQIHCNGKVEELEGDRANLKLRRSNHNFTAGT